MDPVTIIGGATVAFNALKKGFQVGKDLQDMSGQLTQWAGAMSDLSYAKQKNKNPPWWKALNGQSVEAEALAIFTAKRKAEAMRKELKDWISFSMGPSAWDELVATEGRIRKHLCITRFNPERADRQEMLTIDDISKDILRVPTLGVIPECPSVLQASNEGKPVILYSETKAGQGYDDLVARFLGEDRPYRHITAQPKGWLARLFGA